MAPSVEQSRGALQEVLAYLEGLPQPPVTIRTRIHEVAAGALVRLKSQVRAALLLSGAPGVEPSEIDLVARSALESTISIGWVGTDEVRAARFRNHGVSEAEKHVRLMAERVGFDIRTHPAVLAFLGSRIDSPGADNAMPTLEVQAKEADEANGGSFFTEGYNIAFRRHSSSAHGDSRALLLLLQPRDDDSWKQMAICDMAIAAGALLIVVAKSLNLPGATEAARRLFGTIAPGRRLPSL